MRGTNKKKSKVREHHRPVVLGSPVAPVAVAEAGVAAAAVLLVVGVPWLSAHLQCASDALPFSPSRLKPANMTMQDQNALACCLLE